MNVRQFYDWQTMGGAKDVSRLVVAYCEPKRRPTKKLKDILDIGRLVEAHPELHGILPDEIFAKLNP